MDRGYPISSTDPNYPLPVSREFAAFRTKDGQLLVPILDFGQQAQVAIKDRRHGPRNYQSAVYCLNLTDALQHELAIDNSRATPDDIAASSTT